jgi:type I restriction enzyme R subunit
MHTPTWLPRRARVEIDGMLAGAGWARTIGRSTCAQRTGLQSASSSLRPPRGRANCLLFIDKATVGAIEAKPAGTTPY